MEKKNVLTEIYADFHPLLAQFMYIYNTLDASFKSEFLIRGAIKPQDIYAVTYYNYQNDPEAIAAFTWNNDILPQDLSINFIRAYLAYIKDVTEYEVEEAQKVYMVIADDSEVEFFHFPQ